MYGNGWKDNGNGTFTSTSARSGYSALDLYLMGMIPKEKVPPMLLIDNPLVDKTKMPELGATVSGTAKTVTIDDIIAAEGVRIPDSASSPKKFNVGFVLLTRPGESAGTAPAVIETVRSAWAGRLAELTQGVGGVTGVPTTLNVYIDTPAEGATLIGPDVTVIGSVINSTGAETGVVVNGIPATVTGNRFIVNHVSLQSGTNTLTAAATDVNGLTDTTRLSVTSQAGHYLRIVPNVESGTAPLYVSIRLDSSFSILNPIITANGPVSFALTPGTSPTEFNAQLAVEGTYTISVSSIGPDGNKYSDAVVLTVLARPYVERLLQNKWTKMKERISVIDIDGAVSFIGSRRQAKYREFFTALGTQLPILNDYLKDIELVYIAGPFAKGRLYRNRTIMGQIHKIEYVIYFVQEDGIWKIVQF
jgi:hypothetical protein